MVFRLFGALVLIFNVTVDFGHVRLYNDPLSLLLYVILDPVNGCHNLFLEAAQG